jgi:hypothetical protein
MRVKLAITASILLTLLMATVAAADLLICVSEQELKGKETVGQCAAKGDQFAYVDKNGVVRILTPEELALTRKINPKLFEQPAYGMRYYQEKHKLPPLPVSPEEP